MRHLFRLPFVLVLAGCASGPSMLASAGLGCERTDDGPRARTIAIYTRVVAEKVCVVDAAGRCHPRVDDSSIRATVRLPATQQHVASALTREFGRRGILARMARPRGPKMYASLGTPNEEDIELGEIILDEDETTAYVFVRTTGMLDTRDWLRSSGGDVMHLQRVDDIASGLSRRMVSPIRACWRLERSNASALAE
jgi:hypothetical protein